MANMSYQTYTGPGVDATVRLGVEDGSFWVARKGDIRGPTKDHIPSWCEPDSGPDGLWQPCGVFPDGRVLWRRMVRETSPPTPTERLAELHYDDEDE